jgi:hypothetical protein
MRSSGIFAIFNVENFLFLGANVKFIPFGKVYPESIGISVTSNATAFFAPFALVHITSFIRRHEHGTRSFGFNRNQGVGSGHRGGRRYG